MLHEVYPDGACLSSLKIDLSAKPRTRVATSGRCRYICHAMNEAPGELAGDRPRLSAWIPLAILLAAVLAVFGRTIGHDFILLDDPSLIYQNPHVMGAFPGCLATAWQGAHKSLYIPLVYNVWAVLAQLAKGGGDELGSPLNPLVFHLANVLLHGLNACLVYFLLRRLVGKPWPALAGSLVWAIHPLQVEGVAWATGMKDLLSSFLALLAATCYLAACRRGGENWLPRGTALVFWLLAGLSLVAAGLAKPGVVTMPAIFLVLDALVLRRNWRIALAWAAPMLLAALPAMLTTMLVQGMDVQASHPAYQRPIIAGFALFHYLSKLVVPYPLLIDSGFYPPIVLGSVLYKTYAVFAAVIVILVCAVRPLRRWLGVPLLIMVLGLLPVLGLVGFYFQNFSVVADRYMYLAMLGPALLAAWLVQPVKGARPRGVVAALVLVVLGIVAAVQVSHWQDAQTIAEHTQRHNPRSSTALSHLAMLDIRHAAEHDRLAEAMAKEGRIDLAKREQGEASALRSHAIKGLHQSLRYYPEFFPAWRNLIYALEMENRLDELAAVIEYLDAWERRDPSVAEELPLDPRKNAQLYLRLNRLADARRCLQEYLQAHPDDVGVQALLARIPATLPATRP
jgi:hypothetical protein